MSAFTCLLSVFAASQRPIMIGWTVVVCLSTLSASLSIRFVVSMYRNKYQGCENQDQKRFFLLAMWTSVAIACAQFGTLPGSLFWMNQFHPNPSINYETDLNCGKLGFYETIQTVFAPTSGISNDISYISILTVYYTRLVLIFQGSFFELSKNKQLLFRVLIISMIIASIIRISTMFLHQHIGGYIHVHLWNIYLIFYILISLYILICMKQQFNKLIEYFIKNNDNYNNNNNNNSEHTKLLHIRLLMRRFTILAQWCLSSTMIVALFSTLVHQIFAYYLINDSKDTLWIDLMYWQLYFVDQCTNNICLSLQFDFGWNNTVYNMICKKCENLNNDCNKKKQSNHDENKINIQPHQTA